METIFYMCNINICNILHVYICYISHILLWMTFYLVISSQLKFWEFKINTFANELLVHATNWFDLELHSVSGTLSKWAFRASCPPVSLRYSHSQFCLHKPSPQGWHQALQPRGCFRGLWFPFCMAFLNWLRQNPPLNDEDHMLPNYFFPPVHTQAILELSGMISAEEQVQTLW